jgi:hypothetical protein
MKNHPSQPDIHTAVGNQTMGQVTLLVLGGHDKRPINCAVSTTWREGVAVGLGDLSFLSAGTLPDTRLLALVNGACHLLNPFAMDYQVQPDCWLGRKFPPYRGMFPSSGGTFYRSRVLAPSPTKYRRKSASRSLKAYIGAEYQPNRQEAAVALSHRLAVFVAFAFFPPFHRPVL